MNSSTDAHNISNSGNESNTLDKSNDQNFEGASGNRNVGNTYEDLSGACNLNLKRSQTLQVLSPRIKKDTKKHKEKHKKNKQSGNERGGSGGHSGNGSSAEGDDGGGGGGNWNGGGGRGGGDGGGVRGGGDGGSGGADGSWGGGKKKGKEGGGDGEGGGNGGGYQYTCLCQCRRSRLARSIVIHPLDSRQVRANLQPGCSIVQQPETKDTRYQGTCDTSVIDDKPVTDVLKPL